MHLPDGIITSPAVLGAGVAAAATSLSIAHGRCRARMNDRAVARAGVMSAFIFAVQMVNFPVGFGVSGHLLGGTMAAVMLGPALAMVTMAVVVTAQCLFFNDGGLLSLGLNLTTMAIICPLFGGAVAALLTRVIPRAAAWAIASWVSVVAASGAIGGAILWGGPDAGFGFLKLLVGVHCVIGVGEAVITVGVLQAVARLRPDLVDAPARARLSRAEVFVGLASAPLIVMCLAPFASQAPDGLEASLVREGVAAVQVGGHDGAGVLAALAAVAACCALTWAVLAWRPAAAAPSE